MLKSNQHKILIISPVKDEAEYIQKTIDSIVAQVLRPERWIIVNDGSSDATGTICDTAAATHGWIQVIHRPKSTVRRVGPGVVEAFYCGLNSVSLAEYDFVCKLDGDLEFQPSYFSNLIDRFDDDPKLGTASGKCYVPMNGQYVLERTGDEFSHGVAKLYRRECFEAIGGFVREVMWDGIDCHRCRMEGWIAVSYTDPELKLIHLRQMGSSHKSVLHGRIRWGRGQHFMGTHLVYLLGITMYRVFERPWLIGGLCIFWGYLTRMLSREPQYGDKRFRSFLHKWQLSELRKRLARPFQNLFRSRNKVLVNS
jgi:poly-beta-1,6-N-acetyl-D-glucosamine synthase